VAAAPIPPVAPVMKTLPRTFSSMIPPRVQNDMLP
jgi:hypothetical protein